MENNKEWPPPWPTLDGITVDEWLKKRQLDQPVNEEIEEIDMPDPFSPCVLPEVLCGVDA